MEIICVGMSWLHGASEVFIPESFTAASVETAWKQQLHFHFGEIIHIHNLFLRVFVGSIKRLELGTAEC